MIARSQKPQAQQQPHHRRRPHPLPPRILRQRHQQRIQAGIASLGLGLQAAQQHLAQPLGHPRASGSVLHIAIYDVVTERRHRLPSKRRLAMQRLVQRHAEAELIAALIHRLAAVLLGGHVLRRPHQRPRLGQVFVQLLTSQLARKSHHAGLADKHLRTPVLRDQRARQTKIGDAHTAIAAY